MEQKPYKEGLPTAKEFIIKDEKNFDESNNLVEIDMDVVMVEAERLSKIEPPNPQQSMLDLIAELRAEINELKAN